LLLSKLELNGFKSFPHRTELRFDEGIMGVVGPNGCGKTNILDSLRWVLGEQRASMLRGARVEEVIFNGTSQFRSSDMAEVSLTIKNNRGVLPLEYDEVVVTRRLFRSGESEYLINKNRCRLKDIINLFADTGMGTHAYSIFQQSMVDAVLSDKAEERRFLFEEAAGITKYKFRKKEALKKLENTEADVLRLNDIIAEIAKNVRGLKRQASRARRFRSIREELQAMEIIRASAELHALEAGSNSYLKQIKDLTSEQERVGAAIDSSESQIEDLRFRLAGMNEQLSSQGEKSSELDKQAIRIESEISQIQGRIEMSRKNAESADVDILNLKQRIEAWGRQKNSSQAERAAKAREKETIGQEMAVIESDMLSLKGRLDETAQKLEQARNNASRLTNEIAGKEANLEATARAVEQLGIQTRDLNATVAKFKTRKSDSEESLLVSRIKLRQGEENIASVNEAISVNQQRNLSGIDRIEGARRKISELSAERSAVAAKIELLSRMIIEHEGYGSGIKLLFDWKERPPGVIDTLANLVTADKAYLEAVEAAINRYGQLVVCKERIDAIKSIEYLRTAAAGRVSFLLLDSIRTTPSIGSSTKRDGHIGNVADMITCQDYLRPAVDSLFKHVEVYETGKIPIETIDDAVDLEGDFCGRQGIFEGGRSGITFIGRKLELSTFQEKADSLVAELAQLERDEQAARIELNTIEAEAGVLQEKKNRLLEEREELIAEMTRLEFEFNESISRLDELSDSSLESGRRTESLESEKQALIESIEAVRGEELQVRQELDHLAESHRVLAQKAEASVDEFNKKRILTVELMGLIRKLEEDDLRFAELIQEAIRLIDEKTLAIQEEKDARHGFETTQSALRIKLTELFQAKNQCANKRNELVNQKNDLALQLTESEAKLKKTRQQAGQLAEELHQAQIALAELESSQKNLKGNVFQEYGVHIKGVRSDDYDEQETAARIKRLKAVIERVGPVNMLADDEYNTEKDRLEFLQKQLADLEDAKTTLKEVIRKINKTAEERFSEAFELIRGNFQRVFESLFEGGTAELKLTNADDFLESPIEIIARPGHKKLVSVNQLSGGERALTAISLLFAIYMVKPSPFCILDEIDAPLDDANVTRFIKLIHRFTTATQFIVITHNKRTMEAADLLYGVTMDKPGISRIVSVRFNGGGEPGV